MYWVKPVHFFTLFDTGIHLLIVNGVPITFIQMTIVYKIMKLMRW